MKTLDEQNRLEKNIPELEEVYTPVNQLYVPEEARQLYASQGYDLHWVRLFEPGTQGQLDLKNIQLKEGSKYEFVKRDEIPGLNESMTSFFKDKVEDTSFGLYVVGDLALAKVPFSYLKAKKKYNEEITRSRSKAIIDDLRKNAVLPDPNRGEVIKVERGQPTPRKVEFGE